MVAWLTLGLGLSMTLPLVLTLALLTLDLNMGTAWAMILATEMPTIKDRGGIALGQSSLSLNIEEQFSD